MNKIIVHSAGLEFVQPLLKIEWLGALFEYFDAWRMSQFRIGDLLNHGSQQFGEKFVEMQPILKRDYVTLANYKSIAKRVTLERRRIPPLSFGHHDAVAALNPESQSEFLRRAEAANMPVQELRAAIRQEFRTATVTDIGKSSSGPDLLSWFADGFRLLRSADEWTPATRRAFDSQWERLTAAVDDAGMGPA